ncbi:MAG: hypothetical protein E3K36_15430 [Candidatus Brocadia sp.]|nr:hypothetical protein [Candidatus Brocadia sp.]
MAIKNITYKVPKNDREVFVDPAINRIPDLVHENRQKIQNYQFEMNGIPFRVLRDKTREDLLSMAANYTEGMKSLIQRNQHSQYLSMRDDAQKNSLPHRTQGKLSCKGTNLDYETIKGIPIVQTGHEPILYYPGVWIKNHLTQFLARKMGGIGVNMIVDNDACNMGFMYVPILSERPATIRKIALVECMDHVAYEEIVFNDSCTILRFKDEVLTLFKKNVLDEKVKTTVVSMQSTFEEFINCIVERYHQGCTDMVGLLTAARRALEEDFCIDNLEVPVSWMCNTDGFYHFLLHIINEAERFAKIYNEKLSEYRSIHKIRSKANPLPDIKIAGNFVELPFWIWKAGGQRGKCYMMREGQSLKVTNGVDVIVTLGKSEETENNISRLRALRESQIKIRPRAITTTMFSRLFFSDVFIHGIGGAKYDTITDEIIKEFFGVDPPAFITISATLFLPFDAYDLDIKTLQVLQHELTDISYNPERYASKEAQGDREFVNRVSEKKRLLEMMASCSKDEKRRYFNKIKELNKLNLIKIDAELQRKRKEITTINEILAYNEAVKFREYPLCIYPMKVLREYFLNVFSEG